MREVIPEEFIGLQNRSHWLFLADDLSYSTLERRLEGDKKRFAAQGNPIERLAHGESSSVNEEAVKLAQELNISHDLKWRLYHQNCVNFIADQ